MAALHWKSVKPLLDEHAFIRLCLIVMRQNPSTTGAVQPNSLTVDNLEDSPKGRLESELEWLS